LLEAEKDVKQRRRIEMISQIKYTLIFDERVDRKELDAIFENDNGDKHLMDEIVAEDKICEVMAKNEI
jgi:hypothetical protein